MQVKIFKSSFLFILMMVRKAFREMREGKQTLNAPDQTELHNFLRDFIADDSRPMGTESYPTRNAPITEYQVGTIPH